MPAATRAPWPRLSALLAPLALALASTACAFNDGLDHGRAAPDLDVDVWLNADGDVDLDSLRGKHVLIEFWSNRCPACVKSLPDMRRLAREYCCDTLEILSVHMPMGHSHLDGHINEVEKFLDAQEVPYPVGIDHYGTSSVSYDFKYLPHAVLVDPQGMISWSGSLSVYDLESKIRDRIGAPETVSAGATTPLFGDIGAAELCPIDGICEPTGTR